MRSTLIRKEPLLVRQGSKNWLQQAPARLPSNQLQAPPRVAYRTGGSGVSKEVIIRDSKDVISKSIRLVFLYPVPHHFFQISYSWTIFLTYFISQNWKNDEKSETWWGGVQKYQYRSRSSSKDVSVAWGSVSNSLTAATLSGWKQRST